MTELPNLELITTDLMEDKLYMKWDNYWVQFILNGIIPIVSLIYFNVR